MKALSIKQPWAHAIIYLGKDIENRDWRTLWRGRFAVHASGRLDPDEYAAFHSTARGVPALQGIPLPTQHDLKLGCIIGTVELVGCLNDSDSPWFVGDYGFLLRDPIALPEPIPCRGALGFWSMPEEIAALIKPCPRKTPHNDRK